MSPVTLPFFNIKPHARTSTCDGCVTHRVVSEQQYELINRATKTASEPCALESCMGRVGRATSDVRGEAM